MFKLKKKCPKCARRLVASKGVVSCPNWNDDPTRRFCSNEPRRVGRWPKP
jgi:uncharacterized Zn finger protein (UPF0148 family)